LIVFFTAIIGNAQVINGISFVASRDSISQKHTAPLVRTNANYVALMPYGFLRNLNSSEVLYNTKYQWYGEREEGIKQYVNQFRNTGCKIMLKPQLWVGHGEYTGHIKMKSEAEWKILESSYEEFILTFARLAEDLDIESFCIGVEMESFIKERPDFWFSLIQKVRDAYCGQITYAANWDDFNDVPFWQAVDYIGINAYFPLTNSKTPSVIEFTSSWQPIKKKIEQLHLRTERPVMFTEYGYRSVDYNGKEPWVSNKNIKAVNLQAQLNAIKAIYQVFWHEPWFLGGFLWKWHHDHDNVGGEQNDMFTIQNKPSEDWIREFYKEKH